MRQGPRKRGRPAGFTLIELGIVIVIIGILIGFILTVGSQGVRSAEIRATQSLITKLDAGLTDLVEQIVNNRIDPNGAHRYLAAIPNYAQNAGLGTGVPGVIVDADAPPGPPGDRQRRQRPGPDPGRVVLSGPVGRPGISDQLRRDAL